MGFFKCPKCPKTYPTTSSLNRHIKSSHGKKKFICPKCGKEYGLKGQFDLHMKAHNNEKSHICPKCQQGFLLVGNLNIHLRDQHPEGGKKRTSKCPHCDKLYFNDNALKLHMKVGHPVGGRNRDFICSKCNKGFYLKITLDHHMLNIHSEGDRTKVKCHKCDVSFYRVGDLNRHLKDIHPEGGRKRKWKCQFCSKAYYREAHLAGHQSEDPCCHHCNSTHACSGKLMVHYKTCSNAPPEARFKSYRMIAQENGRRLEPRAIKLAEKRLDCDVTQTSTKRVKIGTEMLSGQTFFKPDFVVTSGKYKGWRGEVKTTYKYTPCTAKFAVDKTWAAKGYIKKDDEGIWRVVFNKLNRHMKQLLITLYGGDGCPGVFYQMYTLGISNGEVGDCVLTRMTHTEEFWNEYKKLTKPGSIVPVFGQPNIRVEEPLRGFEDDDENEDSQIYSYEEYQSQNKEEEEETDFEDCEEGGSDTEMEEEAVDDIVL